MNFQVKVFSVLFRKNICIFCNRFSTN